MLATTEVAKRGDIFAPGSPDYMEGAIKDGVIDPKSVRIVAYMVPAIVVLKGNPKNMHLSRI